MSIDFIQRTFSSLKHQNFRLFFAGQSVSLIGSWMHQTALSWLIYQLTSSKLLLGVIGAISPLPMLFLSVLGGVFADKYPKKTILLLTQIISMFFAFILAVLVVFDIIRIWHIIVLALLSGIVFAIDMPVRQSFYIDIVSKEDLMNAVALNSSMVNLARVIGPAIAGVIMAKLGMSWCFILNVFSFFAVIYALIKIKLPNVRIIRKPQTIIESTISGFNYVKSNKEIFYLIILMMFVSIFGWSYAILFPAIAKDIFLKGEGGYAALVSANGLGALCGALLVAYLGRSNKKKQLVNWGIYLFSFAILFLAFCKTYWLSLILVGCAGIGIISYFASSTAIVQSDVDDEMRGRVMGIWSLAFGGTVPLGFLFTGVFAQYFGISATLVFSASICFFSTVILAIFLQPQEEPRPVLVETSELQEESSQV